MRTALTLLVALLLALSSPHGAGAQAPPDAVPQAPPDATARSRPPMATVNGVPIFYADIEAELTRMSERLEKYGGMMDEGQRRGFKTHIFNAHLEAELIRQAIVKRKIFIPEQAVEQELDSLFQRMGSQEKFERLAELQNRTMAQVREDIRLKLATRRLLAAELGQPDSPQAIEERYRQHPEHFTVEEEVHASHILIKVEEGAPAAEARAARRQIDALRRKATARGADFAQLARDHSQCPSAPRGGDLGRFTRGRMVKPFEDAAFALKVGAVSAPIQTRFGWHLILVHDHTPRRIKPLDEVRDQIAAALRAEQERDGRSLLIAQLKTKATITILDPDLRPSEILPQ